MADSELMAKNGIGSTLGGALEVIGRLAALAAVFLTFGFLVPNWAFFSAGNVENIVLQSAVYTMAGLGMTMVIITGGIDLAAGSTIALAMVVTAMTLAAGKDYVDPATKQVVSGYLKTSPFTWTMLSVLAGTAAGTIVGLVQGLLITSLRLVPFIVTLGGLTAIRGFTKYIADNQEISPPSTNWLFQHLMQPVQRTSEGFNPQVFSIGVWATIAMSVLAAGLLRYTKLGRHIYAVGSNEATARLCGVPVFRTKVIVYTLAGLFAGMAGVLEFSKLNLGQPTGALSYELYVITACVIGGASLSGGVGTIFGTVVGALIIGTLNAGTQQAGWEKSSQEIAVGVIIVVAVALDQLRMRGRKN